MKQILNLVEFAEIVNNIMEEKIIEDRKGEWTDEDRDYGEMLNILLKCQLTKNDNPKNKKLYDEIITWCNKWFGKDKTEEIENSIAEYANNIKDKYTEYLLNE